MTTESESGVFPAHHGMELSWRRWIPEGRASAIVALIHGFGEHSGRYGDVARSLGAGGVSVCAFDLRGHGLSPGQRGHIDSWRDYREDLTCFLRLIRNRAESLPLFLFGHSMGGLIALDWVLANPRLVNGAALAAPVLTPPRLSPLRTAVGRMLSSVWPTFSIRARIKPQQLFRDTQAQQEREEDPLVHGHGSARLSTELRRTVQSVNEQAGQLGIPLLICHGSGDRLVSIEGSRAFASAAPSGMVTFMEYPDASHELHRDAVREAFLSDLLRWFATIAWDGDT